MKTELFEKYQDATFRDEETFNRIYEECLENEPQASEGVKNAYSEMRHWFKEYLSEVQMHLFRYAYQCGYEAGLRKIRERIVPEYLLKGGAEV